jgi:hypothetical protein
VTRRLVALTATSPAKTRGYIQWDATPGPVDAAEDVAVECAATVRLRYAAARVLGPKATREQRTRLVEAYAACDAI